MKLSLVSLGALVLCTSAASHAAANGAVSPATVAGKFVDALQHHRHENAAAMFAPEATRDTVATERTLKRIDESLGGFSTLHPIAKLPDGKTIKLELPSHGNIPLKEGQKFIQVRYASTASDGQPVFYEVNLTTDTKPPQVLSFGVHFPTPDAQSAKRAAQLVSAITR